MGSPPLFLSFSSPISQRAQALPKTEHEVAHELQGRSQCLLKLHGDSTGLTPLPIGVQLDLEAPKFARLYLIHIKYRKGFNVEPNIFGLRGFGKLE